MNEQNEFITIDIRDAELREVDFRKVIEDNFQKDETFSSHQFIQKYAKQSERRYIALLCKNSKKDMETGIFRVLHSEIARFLLKNEKELGIEKQGDKVEDKSIFGNDVPNACWKRVK